MKRLPREFGQRHRIPSDIQLNAVQAASIIKLQFPAFGLKTGRREYIEAGRRALDLCLGGLELPYTKT